MKKSEATFKHWSFVFFITVLVLNILFIFLHDSLQLLVIGLLSTFFLALGTILGFISFLRREKNDYKKYIGFIGNLILLVLGIAHSFLSNV